LPFLASQNWKVPRKCVVEVQMQILLRVASLMVFRCAKSLFRASLVEKSRDLGGFRVEAEFLECSRHTWFRYRACVVRYEFPCSYRRFVWDFRR
jgi:hypothetical protein